MRKSILAASLAVLSALSLSGCVGIFAGNHYINDDDLQDEAAYLQENYPQYEEIYVWSSNDSEGFSSDKITIYVYTPDINERKDKDLSAMEKYVEEQNPDFSVWAKFGDYSLSD